MEQTKKDIDNLIKEVRLLVKENILYIVDEINDDLLKTTKAKDIEQILGIKIDEYESIYEHIYKYVVREVLKFDFLESEGK